MEIVSEAYISLANCPHKAEKSSKGWFSNIALL